MGIQNEGPILGDHRMYLGQKQDSRPLLPSSRGPGASSCSLAFSGL